MQKEAKQAGVALAEAVVKADQLYEAVRLRQAEALEAARQAIQDDYQENARGNLRAMGPGGRDREGVPGAGRGRSKLRRPG